MAKDANDFLGKTYWACFYCHKNDEQHKFIPIKYLGRYISLCKKCYMNSAWSKPPKPIPKELNNVKS